MAYGSRATTMTNCRMGSIDQVLKSPSWLPGVTELAGTDRHSLRTLVDHQNRVLHSVGADE